jgi:hypothetical protein
MSACHVWLAAISPALYPCVHLEAPIDPRYRFPKRSKPETSLKLLAAFALPTQSPHDDRPSALLYLGVYRLLADFGRAGR